MSRLLSSADAVCGSLERLFQMTIVVTLPVILLWTSLLIMLTRPALLLSYAQSNIPAERGGWTEKERLMLAWPSYEFLRSLLPPEDAANMLRTQMDPHTDALLFSEREVLHMIDVKEVLDQSRKLGATLFLLASVSFIVLWRRRSRFHHWKAVRNGSMLTLLLIAIAGVFMTQLPWSEFFTGLHQLFFERGSWTFGASSGLILLFPSAFWKFQALAFVIVLIAQTIVLLSVALHYHGRHEQRRARAGI